MLFRSPKPELKVRTRSSETLSVVPVRLTPAPVMIKNAAFTANTTGLETEGTSQVSVDSSQISNNGTGFQVVGGTVRVSNTDVAFNTALASGTINSFTTNRFAGNGAGGVITAVGGPTSATGQQ